MEKQFRFQDFEIWQKGVAISGELFSLADEMERRKLFRFAEQLRGAVLSITNNIAEGSGSVSEPDFRHFLNMARRSVFEVANMLLVFSKQGYVSDGQITPLLSQLEVESKQILSFMRSLR
jgi:four helix bundle protein